MVRNLDLLVDEHGGQLDGGVGHRELDDPIGKGVAGLVEGVAPEPLADLHPQRGQIDEVTHRSGEVIVLRRLDLLAQLLELHHEVGGLAGQGRLAVVGRKLNVKVGRLPR